MREIYRSGLFLGNNTASMAIVKRMVLIIVERILGFWVGDFEVRVAIARIMNGLLLC